VLLVYQAPLAQQAQWVQLEAQVAKVIQVLLVLLVFEAAQVQLVHKVRRAASEPQALLVFVEQLDLLAQLVQQVTLDKLDLRVPPALLVLQELQVQLVHRDQLELLV
jgi:hypothetical protein